MYLLNDYEEQGISIILNRIYENSDISSDVKTRLISEYKEDHGCRILSNGCRILSNEQLENSLFYSNPLFLSEKLGFINYFYPDTLIVIMMLYNRKIKREQELKNC